MRYERVFIPYGGYWSTPFVRWQGRFANLHPLEFAAEMTTRALHERGIAPASLNGVHLGTTVPSKSSFYGGPWLAGMIGAEGVTGPSIAQACATSARVIAGAACEIEATPGSGAILNVCADRTSNGPHILYPNPAGPGGKGDAEDWVWDNFNYDPFANNSMLQTAENVARESDITTSEQHEVVLMRYEQYQSALAETGAFLRRYMLTPIEVRQGRKILGEVVFDEGVTASTAEGLARLRPLMDDGTVTYGGQTYPADGNCGLVVATQERARELSLDHGIAVQLLSYGQGRAKRGYMAQATVPAAKQALEHAGVKLEGLKAIKTHNPFAVNDVYFSRTMGVDLQDMNNYGSSLIWGHPQGPTGMRLLIELIEELAVLGGGCGLFVGCAAGDTAAGLVVRVDVA